MEKYTLIVTEKLDVAKRIAYALDRQGKPKYLKKNGLTYFEAQRDRQLIVVPAIGHLYAIVQERGKRNYYPVFNFKWIPRHLAERGAKSIRNWVETFSELSNDADKFISACDFDIEGSLIGYCILKYACGNKDGSAKRMRFSTLLKSDLEKAYEESLPHLDFKLIEAGRTRHEVDWLYGINLSRALTLAARRWNGRHSTLSMGRVQGPTLQFLVSRENEIRSFVPTPYWKIIAEAQILNSVVEVEYKKKRIKTSAEADSVLRACAGKTGEVVKIDVRTVYQKPPVPFDVGTLQREAYNLFEYTPRQTLAIAQRLYLDSFISYPRTGSQKLPSIIGYRKILKSLKRQFEYKKLASKLLENEKLKPNEGAKDDPAHPAVYPTGNLPEKPLGVAEKRIWDLIIRRFMAVFGEDSLKESIKVRLELNNHGFFLRGIRLLKEGWIEYYKPYIRAEERLLPPLKEGDTVQFRRVIRKNKFTCPPPRYNPSSLFIKMEKLGIGTKATRADIIQTLYNRGYIMDKRIVVTQLGFDLIDILSKYVSVLISTMLTRDLESKMDQIQKGKIRREIVLSEFVEQLKPQLAQFKENEENIGEALSKATTRAQIQERTVGRCPNCGTGEIRVIHSRTTKKRFIGCTNYFKGLCKTSFPLPQRGIIKPANNHCKVCAWPTVLVTFRGKKPWNMCFNLDCPLKKKWRKKP